MSGERRNVKPNLYFVIQSKHASEENVSEEMKLAFSNATDWSLKPKWIREDDCTTIDSKSKGNVFIFEEFVGEFFNEFVATYRHARIIGPKCLITCFAENISIPNTQYPIYNLAMNGFLVTTSIAGANEKKKIMDLVGFMGGNCTDVLTKNTTHLIVSSIMSEKYLKAKENNIPVLRSEWITELWQRSQVNDINGTNEELVTEYKCPMFYKLNVTTSQLNENEKKKIKKCIEDNGGTYSAELQRDVTNLLIIPIGRGEKYKFATRWKIKCVNPKWLEQSVAKEYALRFDDFIVQSGTKCSTPINSYNQARIGTLVDTNDTDISAIPSENVKTVVSETATFDMQTQNEPVQRNDANVFKTPVKNHHRNDKSFEDPTSYQKILNSIKVNEVQKCQHLLDGCKVYLAGFNGNEEEKLRRILKYGGALRFTDLNESVTHVIVGNPTFSQVEALKNIAYKPHVVKLDWLSSSITKGCLEREDNCAFFHKNNEPSDQSCAKGIQQPSPLSKKGMQMLNPVRQIPISSHPIVGADQILIEKYASSQDYDNHDIPPVNVIPDSAPGEQLASLPVDKLFNGLCFAIVGHTTSSENAIKTTLSEYGATIVSDHRSVVDYTIMPFTNRMMRVTSTEVVTILWIEECLSCEKVVEPKYYHRPVTVSDKPYERTLKDCVITLSSFVDAEKTYLINVAHFLGAKCQEVLSKKQNIEKGIWQTTHLVCSRAEGVKYNAAKKWNLPVVTKDWLLCCLNTAEKLPIPNYLVTEDVVPDVQSSSSTSKQTNKPESDTTPQRRSEQQRLASQPKTTNMTNVTNATNAPASANVPSETPNNQPSMIPPNDIVLNNNSKSRTITSFRLNAKATPVERAPFTTPSIADAVHRSTHRNMTNNENGKNEAPAQKDWPTGLLLNIHACTSSSVKRKLDCQQNDVPEPPQDFPRNKLVRYDNQSSSPYEEVGWQDTLSDLSNVQADYVDGLEKNVNSKPNTTAEKNVPTAANPSATVRNADEECQREPNNVAGNNASVICLSAFREQSSRPTRHAYGNFLISMPSVTDSRKKKANRTSKRRDSLENEKRTRYEKIIENLGGRVLATFPTDCAESEKATHIIIDELKKTEKLLCSVASGIWVLHSSYLDRCAQAKKFLPEENFEWGNPLNEKLLIKASRDISLIARAAHRWRMTVLKGGLSSRPFIGMKAVIVGANEEVFQSLTRVVESGGGSVLPICDILSCTHCLSKSSKLELIPVTLQQLFSKKIHCVPAVYLSDYLMNDPPPDVKTCYFDQYKRLFKM